MALITNSDKASTEAKMHKTVYMNCNELLLITKLKVNGKPVGEYLCAGMHTYWVCVIVCA